MDFTVGIPPDSDEYVADVFWQQTQWAELRLEQDELRLTIFSAPIGQAWDFSFNEAVEVLQRARQRLEELARAS